MPTVLQIGPYTIFFYTSDGSEQPHVHVRRDKAIAKLWLNPVCLQRSRGFNDHELRKLQTNVEKHKVKF